MQILKHAPPACAALILLVCGCGAGGPLTPEEAFARLKRAYAGADASMLVDLLSRRSRNKIDLIIAEMRRLDAGQAKAISRQLGVPEDRLRGLTPVQYIALQLELSRRYGDDTVSQATAQEIIGTDVKDGRAVVRVDNGMELIFVKEGPYWKYEME